MWRFVKRRWLRANFCVTRGNGGLRETTGQLQPLDGGLTTLNSGNASVPGLQFPPSLAIHPKAWMAAATEDTKDHDSVSTEDIKHSKWKSAVFTLTQSTIPVSSINFGHAPSRRTTLFQCSGMQRQSRMRLKLPFVRWGARSGGVYATPWRSRRRTRS
ncbi:MAG: hypothetical protein QOK23_2570 [Gammaproteobacteria bacterium]|jgi:hypothetical protein|nr:hypothetical protein [Gammaproteobacteria bacterium]